MKLPLLAMLIITLISPTFGQFGKLKSKVQEKVEDSNTTNGGDVTNTSIEAEDKDNGVGGLKKNLDFSSQPFPPAVAFYDLLSPSCLYFNPIRGEFKLNSMDVSFLPTKTKSGEEVKYETYNNPKPLIWMDVVNKADAQTIGTLYYGASSVTAPFSQLKLKEGSGYPLSVTITEGDFDLKFYVGGSHFYTYPISVEKMANSDPYAPVSSLLFLKGQWKDWGRIEINKEGTFIWAFYHSYKTMEIDNSVRYDKKKEFEYKMTLKKGGTTVAICDSDPGAKSQMGRKFYAHNSVWEMFDSSLFEYPMNGRKSVFTKDKLTNGDYTMVVEIKDMETSKTETNDFPFKVNGGKVMNNDAANRDVNKDALTFLEQGRKYTYVKKK